MANYSKTQLVNKVWVITLARVSRPDDKSGGSYRCRNDAITTGGS